MRWILSLLILVGFSAPAFADKITARVAVTNAAGTTNGQTITVNGNVRTWTNNVIVALSQIATNSTAAGAKTNMYSQFALNPFSQINQLDAGSTNLDLVGASGLAMAVTLSAGWGTVSYSTQTVASGIAVVVPVSGEATVGQRTNIMSLLEKDLNDFATNGFYESSPIVQHVVGLTNVQTITGAKTFSSFGGTATSVTNGGFLNPSTTNLANYGNAISSPGVSGTGSEQFGTGAIARNTASTAVGNSAVAVADYAVAVGALATASNVNSTAIGTLASAQGINSTALGTGALATNTSSTALSVGSTATNGFDTAIGVNSKTTAAHQVRLGTASEHVSIPGNLNVEGSISNVVHAGTNVFPAGSDVSFGRYALTSLANGNNAAVPVGTNVVIDVSGPTGAFTINGIAGGRDGKMIVVVNLTGQNMTIAHDSGTDPTPANRITSLTGSDQATTGNGAAWLWYNSSTSRWILLHLDQ
jgi:hypothetical protein